MFYGVLSLNYCCEITWDLCQFPGLLRRSSHNLKSGSGVTLDNWQLVPTVSTGKKPRVFLLWLLLCNTETFLPAISSLNRKANNSK